MHQSCNKWQFVQICFGAIEDFGFDFGLWNWKGQKELMNYNAREGKKLFNSRDLSRNVSKKWSQIFSPDFKLKWQDVQVKRRSKMGASFHWSLWHKALTVNTWREKINHNIQMTVPLMNMEPLKPSCISFGNVLELGQHGNKPSHFFYSLKSFIDTSSAWRPLNLEQCIYNKKIAQQILKI